MIMCGECVFCRRFLIDGKVESGYTGEGADWMLEDGDYGCDDNPISCDEGVGPHMTLNELIEIYVDREMIEGSV
jgi:hypothetical protein